MRGEGKTEYGWAETIVTAGKRRVVGIAARCVCGAPTVVMTRPRLDDGTPFPTLYYLSHPAATVAMSNLARRMEAGIVLDPSFRSSTST